MAPTPRPKEAQLRRDPPLFKPLALGLIGILAAVIAALKFPGVSSPLAPADPQPGAAASVGTSNSRPLQDVVTQARQLQSDQPFAALDLLEGVRIDKSDNGDAAWSSKVLAAYWEQLAEVRGHLKLSSAVAARALAVEVRGKPGSNSTIQELLLANVGLIDAQVKARQYSDALAQVKRTKDFLSASGVAKQAKGPTSPVAGLQRVEASVRDCAGDSMAGLQLFIRSLGVQNQTNKQTAAPLYPPRGEAVTSSAQIKLTRDYIQLLWRAIGAAGDAREPVARSSEKHPRAKAALSIASMKVALKHATNALVAVGPWTRPDQLPMAYVLGLTARPWHRVEEHHPVLAPLQALLRYAHASLVQEYHQLKQKGLLLHETECIHDASSGAWQYYTVNGHWIRERDKNGCSLATPAACALMQQARDLQSVIPKLRILRAGYSAVSGRSHLRPHCGISNSQLKFHLGLIVPVNETTGEPCARLTVGATESRAVGDAGRAVAGAGGTRAWAAGEVLFFDDSFVHEVHHDCDAERVVFQLVISHPDGVDEEDDPVAQALGH